MTGGDLFSNHLIDPVLSQLSCIGSEDSITECSNNTANIGQCSSAVAICQGQQQNVLQIRFTH